jgi:AcrR family transcriptional regulator
MQQVPTNQLDRTEARILDAAYAQVMLVGFRRTTLTDVAERAGVSRMTVYSRYPDVSSVLQALMMREFSWILQQSASERSAQGDRREQIISEAVRGLELLSTHELFQRLLDVDPELLLPYITQRPGRFQDAVAETLAEQLKEAIADGVVRDDDPERLARSMLLPMRGYAYSARDATPLKQRRLALQDVASMLDGLLRPDRT